jgi:hypothetical protein
MTRDGDDDDDYDERSERHSMRRVVIIGGGAIGLLADGEREAGQAKLLAEFRRARKRGLQQVHEWLADLCFEGEMELTSGNAEVGRGLLAVVVQAGSGHDLLDATALIARALLDEHG